jgi:hypothetical protein
MVRRETITGSHGMYALRTLVRQPNNCSNFPILEVCNLLIAGMLQIWRKASYLHYLNAWNEVEFNQRNPN